MTVDRIGLLENRRHGSLDFPVGFYRMARKAGEPILDIHWHSEAEFLAVENGKAIFQTGLSSFEVQAGEALYIPGGELHGGFPADGSACTYSALVFDLDWLIGGTRDAIAAKLLKPLQRGEVVLPPHWGQRKNGGSAAFSRLMALMELGNSDDPAKELRVKGELYLLFAEFVSAGMIARRDTWEPAESDAPERIKRVLSHIEANFAQKLTIGELAGIGGMSEGHFSRTFKKLLRQTPIEYINRYRLRHAADRLRRLGLSVADVAIECGFDNFSYFTKMFRSVYGCTPSEYRKDGPHEH